MRGRGGASIGFALTLTGWCAPQIVAAPGDTGLVEQEAGITDLQTIPGTDISFSMVYVPGGTFLIGSPADESGRSTDEGPRRAVAVEPFWIGVHEVTFNEYAIFRFRRLDSEQTAVPGVSMDVDAISRPSPPYEDPAQGMGHGAHPAVGMTQRAALQYARWLSEKTGRLYRLPTEAEWEYACRAGEQTAYGFGDDPEALERYAWYAASSGDTHHRVGANEPNRWGIFDMHGNVAEWTMDEYDPDFYATLEGEPAVAPWSRPGRGARHTVRGGAFDDAAPALRCAARLPSTPDWQRRDPQLPKSRWWNTDSPHVGFRLVRPAKEMSLEEIRGYWDDLLGT
jgi:formylglycine-generating enzyme required for sulfatase activity